MKVKFRLTESKYKSLLERTYTVGDTQYWKRAGKYYSWTEAGGKKEISQDDYFKALAGSDGAPAPKAKTELPKIDRKDYKKAEDRDLALLAASGDEYATDIIIRRYEPLVHKLANKYYLKGGDHDDLAQEGLLGMWDAIQNYDGVNTGFSTYIAKAIDGRLKSKVRSEGYGKNQININTDSMDAESSSEEGEGRTGHDTIGSSDPTPAEYAADKDRTETLLNFMRTELAPKERDAIFRFINGSTISQIAEDMGVSYKSVENAIARARWKIKEFRDKNMGESKKIKEGKRIIFKKSK